MHRGRIYDFGSAAGRSTDNRPSRSTAHPIDVARCAAENGPLGPRMHLVSAGAAREPN